MNNLVTLIDLLDDAGIEHYKGVTSKGKPTITLEVGYKNVNGYNGFGMDFIFNDKGDLESVDIYE